MHNVQFVSIPYSSGLSFRFLSTTVGKNYSAESQSLIHQVSVSDVIMTMRQARLWIGLNPLFIRSQFQMKKLCPAFQIIHTNLSQSLIHQVSVSDNMIQL